jgi:hypothetical protein
VLLDKDGKLVSEVCFKSDLQQRIINMDETHHNLAITGDRGGLQAVSYHNPAFQRGAARGVKSGQHVTGVYATDAAGEVYLRFTYSIRQPSQKRTFVSRWIGLWACLRSQGGLAAQLRSNPTVSLQFARVDQWMRSCSISTLKLSSFRCIPI